MKRSPERPAEAMQQGISLEALTEAFAQAMGTTPSRSEADSEDALADKPEAPAPADEDDRPVMVDGDAVCPVCPRSILEAMLFVGRRDGRPLRVEEAAEPMRGVEPAEIPALVDVLNRRYRTSGCPYEIQSERGGYRLSLTRPFHTMRDRFYGRIREARLSQAAIDVLAIVAYEQPLTAERIGKLRGKPSGHIISQLVRRDLLQIVRSESEPRVAQYHTTDRFLLLFGLADLDDLPRSEELDR
ncbi:MAG: SMC-Scp complex subunit ScpB [Patescibacteria group bacterium]|nr:SMC-Scp complex subunit ScpB [Patescibacteria group bacterium]